MLSILSGLSFVSARYPTMHYKTITMEWSLVTLGQSSTHDHSHQLIHSPLSDYHAHLSPTNSSTYPTIYLPPDILYHNSTVHHFRVLTKNKPERRQIVPTNSLRSIFDRTTNHPCELTDRPTNHPCELTDRPTNHPCELTDRLTNHPCELTNRPTNLPAAQYHSRANARSLTRSPSARSIVAPT